MAHLKCRPKWRGKVAWLLTLSKSLKIAESRRCCSSAETTLNSRLTRTLLSSNKVSHCPLRIGASKVQLRSVLPTRKSKQLTWTSFVATSSLFLRTSTTSTAQATEQPAVRIPCCWLTCTLTVSTNILLFAARPLLCLSVFTFCIQIHLRSQTPNLFLYRYTFQSAEDSNHLVPNLELSL